MAERDFLVDGTRAAVVAAVKSIEATSAAEVVVALRRRSGRYGEADCLFGAVVAFLALAALLYSPPSFSVRAILLWPPLAFLLGNAVCAHLSSLRRLLVSKKAMAENVARAGRAFFVDHGITRTRHRTGILVYLSLFERRAEFVLDLGVDPSVLGPAFGEARARIESAIVRYDLPAFLAALRALGPVLASALPCQPDDENELPDDMDEEEGR